MRIPWLDSPSPLFPPTQMALEEPNGLLAAGGKLSEEWLVAAYSQGIFPWFSDGEPVLWWSPSPRMVLTPDQFHVGRTLRKLLKKPIWTHVSFDSAFEEVIQNCADIERNQDGTWITLEMEQAYFDMHKAGLAHSVEVWNEQHLVGGLYGITIGSVFFGESMFSITSGASKIAFYFLNQLLNQNGLSMIDCQVHTQHLESFGAKEIPRQKFETALKQGISQKGFSTDIWEHVFKNGALNV